MSTTTHDFQIGQRVVVANPSAHSREFAGRTGIYVGDDANRRLLVCLDADRCVYGFKADWLEPEPRTVTVALTEPEAKLVRMALTGLMRSESGSAHEIMRLVVEKINHALPDSET